MMKTWGEVLMMFDLQWRDRSAAFLMLTGTRP